MSANFDLTPRPEFMPEGYTHKQLVFCDEYIFGDHAGNGTESAKKAGYSEKTANEIAAENLAKPSIRKRIVQLEAIRWANTKNSFDQKLYHLNTALTECLSGNTSSSKEGKIDIKGLTSVIDIHNKMLGHYAATKEIVDSTQTVELSPECLELAKKYERNS